MWSSRRTAAMELHSEQTQRYPTSCTGAGGSDIVRARAHGERRKTEQVEGTIFDEILIMQQIKMSIFSLCLFLALHCFSLSRSSTFRVFSTIVSRFAAFTLPSPLLIYIFPPHLTSSSIRSPISSNINFDSFFNSQMFLKREFLTIWRKLILKNSFFIL